MYWRRRPHHFALVPFGTWFWCRLVHGIVRPLDGRFGVPQDADGKPLNASNPRPYILSAVSAVLVAGMMRHVLAASDVTSVSDGAIAGFGIGAFLIVPWMMMNNEFGDKPLQLTVIDGGYAVIGCTLMGTVLMLF